MTYYKATCHKELSDSLPLPRPNRKVKYSHNVIEGRLKQEGYILQSQYSGYKKQLKAICPHGNTHVFTWQNFQNGRRCHCGTRWDLKHDTVEAAFLAEGYILLSTYSNNKAKLNFVCPQGHRHSITWKDFADGARCKYCFGNFVREEDVESAFRKEGYTLKSKYVACGEKLEFTCPQGHSGSVSWTSFRLGRRCRECSNTLPPDPEAVKMAFEAEGYKLLSQYENSKTKVEFECPVGHHHSILWASFRNGTRCKYCFGNLLDENDMMSAFSREGYQCLSSYKNSTTIMDFLCPKGHTWKASWSSFRQGTRCTKCPENAHGGYREHRRGILYYARFETMDGPLWKIGITNYSVKKRFYGEPTPYTVLFERIYEDGSIPPRLEAEIKRKYRKHRYRGYALKSGNTECFTKDVLNYDRPSRQMDIFLGKEF